MRYTKSLIIMDIIPDSWKERGKKRRKDLYEFCVFFKTYLKEIMMLLIVIAIGFFLNWLFHPSTSIKIAFLIGAMMKFIWEVYKKSKKINEGNI